MKHRVYSVFDIARYILSSADPNANDISNLKLQKLCYYAQGIMIAIRGVPLFHENLVAWDHGPVVVELYHHYKGFGANPITEEVDFSPEKIDATDRQILDDVLEYYGQYSAWRLRNMTHEDQPWIEAYPGNATIPIESLKAYFEPQIDEAYVESVYGKAQV